MDYVIIALGIIVLAWAFRQAKFSRRNEAFTVHEQKLLQEELTRAKKDVDLLLKELNTVSEQVVNVISEKIREAEKVKIATPASLSVDLVAAETVERIARSAAKSQAKPNREPKVIDLNLHKQAHEAAGARTSGPRFETVYTLADLDYSISEIARQLQMGKGEVELILSLRHKEENVQA